MMGIVLSCKLALFAMTEERNIGFKLSKRLKKIETLNIYIHTVMTTLSAIATANLRNRKQSVKQKNTFRHCEDCERSEAGRNNPENSIKTIHNHK
jgi:hypothetical protein